MRTSFSVDSSGYIKTKETNFLVVQRHLVERCEPGTRIRVTDYIRGNSALYKVLGVEEFSGLLRLHLEAVPPLKYEISKHDLLLALETCSDSARTPEIEELTDLLRGSLEEFGSVSINDTRYSEGAVGYV